MNETDFFAALSGLAGLSEGAIYALAGVFARVGAAVALLPGFGERTLPMRIKLAAAVAFTLVVWPAVAPQALAAQQEGAVGLARALLSEALAGLVLGVAARLIVMALQLAGSIAAQATSVSQIFGAGATPDPMPAMGAILVVAAVALAMSLGLHVKAARALVLSYQVAPYGAALGAEDLAQWGVSRAADAFAFAFSLSAPFLVAAFAYNVALGAINRAMPQLMVAFVGAPAITAGALALLALAAPLILRLWLGRLDATLAAPFGALP
ncbi:flagellar biosynthetic protein FliR [Oceanicella actignis]|uniref:Flagellar biosynthetic protein FliR n=1 Tax=Oceanicella actignis TaxID=1189325 RepID=A0A1M7T4C9_9RHOB|nr:flagellar biosynthetic protein FliR [Oceanicella actignis]TYO88802.1 flagellar biosynthetic protein FliR [Oceanicella actignis]SET41205.1 flagellar biosynthetic protein FliR [Oceanicella actignis]SHN65524.1 flagellar biosynthetic protein FliR [Oceanicella actignis]